MREILHAIYVILGHIMCKILLLQTIVKDKINPPKEDTVLFVTHPDDDTLFFHTAIKKYKPYVALMVTGWSLKRFRDFNRVMKFYGVRYRAYDTNENSKNVKFKVERQINSVLKLNSFKRCLTHNSEGEYGHHNHQLVHNCVIKQAEMDVFVPVSKEVIKEFPLNNDIVKEKEYIFNTFYTTETFVLDQYSDWVRNEKLVRYEK